MKCHGCHNAPAEVGLLCRACVEANRSRAQLRKAATLERIQATSAKDSPMHRAANSWLFRVLAICVFFVVSFLIIANSGRSASADLTTQSLLAMFLTSIFVGLSSYVWLGLSMYASESHLHGGFILLLYFIFPLAVWRWALWNLGRTAPTMIIHVVATISIVLSLSLLSRHMQVGWFEALEYVSLRSQPHDPYVADRYASDPRGE